MTLMAERQPVLTVQEENRKQLGAFLRARRESPWIRSGWGYRVAGVAARRACAVKRWRYWRMWA